MVQRIVSFLPSSTEILYELGLEAQITGVTHECKYPDSAIKKPRVVNASIDCTAMSSRETDGRIGELSRTGGEIYVLDSNVLKEAMPDLIIAQGVCKVCAPYTKEIERAFEILGYKPDLIVLDPHDLDDILDSIHDVAKKVDKSEEGQGNMYRVDRSVLCGWPLDTTNGRDSRRDKRHKLTWRTVAAYKS